MVIRHVVNVPVVSCLSSARGLARAPVRLWRSQTAGLSISLRLGLDYRRRGARLSEAEVGGAYRGEAGFDAGTRVGERVAGPGAGGDPLALAEAAGARGTLVGEPGEKLEEVAGGVGAGPLDADDGVDDESDFFLVEVDLTPVGEGRAVDETAMHLEVGEHGVARDLGWIDEGGLENFDGGVAGSHGRENFFAG